MEDRAAGTILYTEPWNYYSSWLRLHSLFTLTFVLSPYFSDSAQSKLSIVQQTPLSTTCFDIIFSPELIFECFGLANKLQFVLEIHFQIFINPRQPNRSSAQSRVNVTVVFLQLETKELRVLGSKPMWSCWG